MRRFSKYSILLATLLLGACKKFSPELNVSPNSPSSAPYLLVLTGAEVSGIGIYEGTLARTAGMFSRSFTGSDRQYVDLYNYNTTAEDYNDGWDNLYAGVIAQLQIVEQGALAVNDTKTAGIVEIQLAEAFGFATDLWGDVPFSQVGDPVKYPKPAFDGQAAVFTGVQALLDKGLANIAAAKGAGPGAKDVLLGGDPDLWTAVGNTLKARFFLHVKNYASAITAAKAGISSGDGDLKSPHGSSYLIDFNIYYSFLAYDRPGYMTADGAIAAAYLDGSNPLHKGNTKTNEAGRYAYYYTEGLITSGLDPNVSGPDYDGAPAGFFANNASFPRVTFAENNLILAEAYAKTGDNTNALTWLNNERTYLGAGGYFTQDPTYVLGPDAYKTYDPVDFNAGGIANTGTLSNSVALLTEILKERYVTFIGQVEQFNDVRRTGNFLKIPVSTTAKGSVLPQRFFYAQDEINTNPNTPKLAPADLFKPTPVNTTAY